MKATFTKPMILKAAATLANGGYNGSALQFVRIGDKLEICGTNAYVAAIANVDAKFNRWPDGEGFRFNSGEVLALMRGTSKALKSTDTVTIEIAKGAACVMLDVEGAAVAVSFHYAELRKPINIQHINSACKQAPDGNLQAVAAYFMGLASNAMHTIAGNRYGGWTFKEHGLGNPMEFISKEEPARVLVMPQCEGGRRYGRLR